MTMTAVGAHRVRPPTTTIRPRRTWLPPTPAEIWEFRELLVRFCARDITLRYRQTALGVIWVVLVPLMGAGILSFVFGNVANLDAPWGLPYYVFAFAGMVTWTAFSQVLNRSSSVLLSNAALVGKVFFPRMLLPLSVLLSTLVDVAVALVLLVALLLGYGVRPGLGAFTFPVWLLVVLALALGIGLAAGALMVRYRDIGYIIPVAVQFLLFASPVAYTVASVPAGARWIYDLNPLAGLLEGMRWSLIGTHRPSAGMIAYAITVSAVVLVAGTLIFSRMERQFADVI